MASEQHKQLAAYIKGVHKALRINSKKFGAREAWDEHCKQEEILKSYANAMYELATTCWNDDKKKENSRIHWIVDKCCRYFMNDEKGTEKRKEEEKLSKHNFQHVNVKPGCKSSDLLLLDVGSCYNPFKAFSFFSVVPIDLTPAVSDVIKGDFLKLDLQGSSVNIEDIDGQLCLQQLPENYFDVVIFSLLLEYIPSPNQRYICCEKAYSVLKCEGLLFIITPDSKHANANAQLIKNWRIALAQIGFSRIYYEKLQHLHCLGFRKNLHPFTSQLWAQRTLTKQSLKTDLLDDSVYVSELLKIPQDDRNEPEEEEEEEEEEYISERNADDDALLASAFSELPHEDTSVR